ncbi:LysR family transcriptional regulator [Nocardioides sp.]|uniref:LysR family transcriptional regulator n=1 Tax=Nocardioides sp. TaxID=35761 RepID=UPI001A1E9617|nr:LysR family transcriptional regulator [Nocardioides sp.]MBJ7358271.1 LysR family transcriptional regulator [Nocardioides sp.]
MSYAAWLSFVTVCDRGSISAAADELGYTQSAVSRQVATLEHEMDARLLERLPRGVRPTAAGEAMLRHARLVVHETSRAREAVAAALTGRGPSLAVGAVPSATVGLVPAAIRAFVEQVPSHRCTLRSAVSPVLQDLLLAGDLDVAVVTDYPPGLPSSRLLRRHHLLDDELCAVLPHDHPAAKGRRRLDLSRLADEVWVEDNPGSERLLLSAAGRAGFEPRLEMEAGDLAGKVALVAAGQAVALVPRLMLGSVPDRVAVRRLADPPTRSVFAVHHASPARHRDEVGTFVTALVSAAPTIQR